jgi:hypothetical protein
MSKKLNNGFKKGNSKPNRSIHNIGKKRWASTR